MYIARILYPVQVLGPGNRIGIWVSGCPHRCNGCANPELWEQKPSQDVSMETVINLIEQITANHHVDGFTITGGEPFFQFKDLEKLLQELTKWSSDIVVFSGYTRHEIESFASLDNIAVLIDGPYVKKLNQGLTLRGSSNQTIYILNNEYEASYKLYLKEKYSKVQNFLDGDSVISVGIHKPNFAEKRDQLMKEMGIIKGEAENEPIHTEMA